MSSWAVVLDDVARHGGTVNQVAARLDLPEALVAAIVDHARRLGIVDVAGSCGTTCGDHAAGPACAGCPIRGVAAGRSAAGT